MFVSHVRREPLLQYKELAHVLCVGLELILPFLNVSSVLPVKLDLSLLRLALLLVHPVTVVLISLQLVRSIALPALWARPTHRSTSAFVLIAMRVTTLLQPACLPALNVALAHIKIEPPKLPAIFATPAATPT
jgi:hypothetical protein